MWCSDSQLIVSLFHILCLLVGHIDSHVRRNELQNHRHIIVGHVYNVAHAIVVYMVQGWIRDANLNFGGASHRERVGGSYT